MIEEEFEKIIFLDIDGGLNDEGEQRNKQVINPVFVSNLAKIVKATNADIILTSSWRGCVLDYYRYDGDINEWEKKDVEVLLKLFKENNLEIAGITPMFFNGPDGRPFEVRTWLVNRPNITNFVILDDDTFWNWNWLEDHFVCTKRKCKNSYTYDRGLYDEYVDKAIEILGGKIDDLSVKDE